jgi:hypothetical protein
VLYFAAFNYIKKLLIRPRNEFDFIIQTSVLSNSPSI